LGIVLAKKGSKICWLKIFENFLKNFSKKVFFSFFLNGSIRKVKWLKKRFEDFLKIPPYYRVATPYT